MTPASPRSRPAVRLGVEGTLGLALTAELVLSVWSAPTAQADRTTYVPVSTSWVVDGHGYGHGHGMSQYGAEGAAAQGLSYKNIVHFYYPGTRWDRARGRIRVLIGEDSSPDLQVGPAKGLSVQDLSDHRQWTLPRGHGIDRWRLEPMANGSTAVEHHNANGWRRWHIPDGRKTFRSDGQFHADGPLTLFVPGGGGKVVGRRYRGVLRLVRPSAGAAPDTVNVLGVDSYVKGVVPYEIPASWRPQALRAQAVAARTYASWQRSQNPRRYYHICDTTSCQVYGGAAAEQKSSNAAVEATARKILTYGGKPAFTQFSSSSGGWTAAGGVPYLPAERDPYDGFAANPVHSWTVTVSTSSLERAHPEIGRLISAHVTRRDGHGTWHGRVARMVVKGSNGTAVLSGDDFRLLYGLRSTWFRIEPTSITQRWHELGGLGKAGLGVARSGEFAVEHGAAQTFERGRIFWSRHTGAHELRSGVLGAYRKTGGPGSRIGWPLTGMMAAHAGGHKARFQHGRIYSSKATGAHILYGTVLGRWARAGAASSWLGYPTSNVSAVRGGLRGRFQHGVIRWSRSSGTYRVTRS